MNARKARLLRRMTKAIFGNGVYRHAKDAYAHQRHDAKSVRAAVAAGRARARVANAAV